MNDKIRVILFEDDGIWVAQGLEHDICVQAPSLEELYGRFDAVVQLERREEGGLERIAEAPEHYQKMWDRRSGGFTPREQMAEGIELGLAA